MHFKDVCKYQNFFLNASFILGAYTFILSYLFSFYCKRFPKKRSLFEAAQLVSFLFKNLES